MTATVDLRRAPGAVAIERDVLVVHGPDAVTFLQGQLSQDVAALAVGESRPTFLLQPTGKVDAWMRVTRTADDALLLDVDPGWGEVVHARLRRFLLRTKAELEPGRWSGLALRGPGCTAAAAPGEGVLRLDAAWSGVEGVDLLGPPGTTVHTDLPMVPDDALQALRIEAGVPTMGADVDDTTIPGELGAWAIDASVSFTKGCYTGQELVARIDSRGGNVPRPLRGIVLDASVTVGAGVSVGGADVGRVTSVGTSPDLGPIALAVLARSVAPDAEVHIDVDGTPVVGRVRELPLR